PWVLDFMAKVIVSDNHKVKRATSGADALALLARVGHIDLLVADIDMPGMSGTELAAEARRQMPGLKVLFASGHSDRLFVGHQVLAPRTSFIDKPMTPRGLREAVRLALFGSFNPSRDAWRHEAALSPYLSSNR
ncbi:MAG: response regulator, partial [Vicinamibacterales bacterium]